MNIDSKPEPRPVLEVEAEKHLKHKFGFINSADLSKEEKKQLEKDKQSARESFEEGYNRAVQLILGAVGK